MSFGQFQFRRGTAAQWTSANPILASGELGLETDTSKFKIGDGVTTWNLLPYGGLVGPPPPLASSPPPLVNSGGASVTGVGTNAAREDHTHGLTLASAGGALVTPDVAGIVGVSTLPARQDHTHGLTMATVAPPVINTSGTSTLGTATKPAREDHTHGIALSTTSVQGAMSATDKSRSDNWYNKAVYNVLDNGISTAFSGATNLTAINALMTAAVDNATIFFPPSSSPYDFSGVITTPAGKHFRFQGGGMQKSIIRTTHATDNIFAVGDWYNEFVGLRFMSSVTRTGGAAIQSGNNVAINVYNCSFHEQWIGIQYSGGASAGNLAVVFDCQFTETKTFSIQIDGTNANTIISKCVGDGTAGLCDAHVELNACGSLIMSDCDWIRAVNNLRLNPDSGTKGVFSVYVTNTFFDTASGSSVKFQGGATGTNVQRIKFVNCWFSGSVTGLEFAAVTSTLKPTGIDLTNCDIFSNSSFGILATEVQDFSVTSSRIAGNVTAGIRTNAATGSVTRFTIQNNTIGPASGLGANGIGLDIVAGAYSSYVVSANLMQGNTSNLNLIDLGTVATTDLKQVIDNTGVLLQGNICENRGGVTVGTAETLLFNCRIPANGVSVGQTFKFSIWGQTSGAGTLIFRTRAGAAGTVADANVLSLTTTTIAQAANAWQRYEGQVRVVSIGAGGTVVGAGAVQAQAVWLGQASVAEVVGTVATNAAWFLDFTCACAAAGTFTVRHAVVEAL